MEYVSSDTNVWIDFCLIRQIELPFRLPYTYIMHEDAVDDELLSPVGLRDQLIAHGLMKVDLSMDEFTYAESYGRMYPALSLYDRIALSIAKNRHIVLLTGDGALRKAAHREQVALKGTLGILDELLVGGHIDQAEYVQCLKDMQNQNGRQIRLPKQEITKRLERSSE